MSDLIAIITCVVGITGAVVSLLFWHFKVVNDFKNDIHKLEKQIIQLDNKSENQQQVIDQLKQFLPALLALAKQKATKK